MNRMHVIVATGPLEVNCQILSGAPGRAVLIDPGGDAPLLLARLEELGLHPELILNTHGHFDHLGAVAALQKTCGCRFLIHPGDHFLVENAASHAARWGLPFGAIPRPDGPLSDGQTIEAAGIQLRIIHTPGHSPGGVCIAWDNDLATGDTLFAGSVGRTDLPGGHATQLMASIRDKLLPLSADIRCHPGHGPSTTLRAERHHNPYLVNAG
ncbi:MAG: MBL fold metallo-hydrolase [Magnetococcus sp. WYHC-3]